MTVSNLCLSDETKEKNKGPHLVLKKITRLVSMKKKPAAEGACNRGEQDEQVVHIYMRLSRGTTQYRNIQPSIHKNNVQRMINLNTEWILLGGSP
jgi:hypothetical protein